MSYAAKAACLGLLFLLAGGPSCIAAQPETSPEHFDVVVYEATPGGIAAAISAARLGNSVALVEWQNHIGGMTASGLSKSDIETRGAIGGLFDEFVSQVYQYYVNRYGKDSEEVQLSHQGYYYEPSVAESVLTRMIEQQPRIKLMKRWRLVSALRSANRLTGIRIKNLQTGGIRELDAKIFIDASYEGDLAAYAGAGYRVGRESRSEFGELDAGVVYMDYKTRAFLPGTTGEGDHRVTAYTFRLCLTDNPADSVPLTSPPPDYDRRLYLGYIDDWKAGRLGPPSHKKQGVGYFAPTFGTVVRALSISPIPNHKFDVNINPRPLGFPFAGENYAYPDGSWAQRDAIIQKIRNQTLGLLYFLQNDSEIPEPQRELARHYNLPKDEFTDNQHFPWQLYVREARRIVGKYTLSERDLLVGPELGRTPIHADSIAAGEFPIDSYPYRRREPGHDALEGYILMLDKLTHPYQIPYGVMVPKNVEGLLVPVAVSATHVAFSSVRLEPTWMALGQAAGTAAHLSIEGKTDLKNIPIDQLQRLLLQQGQVLSYFTDIKPSDDNFAAVEYFGTKGFFTSYAADADGRLTGAVARRWLTLAFPGHPSQFSLSIQGNGAVTGVELEKALDAVGAPPVTVSPGPLTRGQFCAALYSVLGKWAAAQEQDCCTTASDSVN